MTTAIVILTYSLAVVLAFGLLYYFRARRWYWHAAAVLVALAIGLKPIPEGWNRPGIDVAIGSILVFLLVWGFFALLFPDHHTRHHSPV